MRYERQDRSGAVLGVVGLIALILALIFLFVVVGVWWIESRFGSALAAAALGGVLVLAAFVGGYYLNHRSTRKTLSYAGDLVYAASDAFKAGAGAQREYARAQREITTAAARAQLIDHKSDRKWEDQRVRALVDAQLAADRAKLDREYAERVSRLESSTAPAWAAGDDGADDSGAGFRFVD